MKPLRDFAELERYRRIANPAQLEAEHLFPSKDILILTGPPGTGKTHQAVKLAVQALEHRKVRRIILTRPTVECGPGLGFLPGKIGNKMEPWLEPIKDVLRSISNVSFAEFMKLVEICPLQYCRGRTFEDAAAILDEAQNCTGPQLDMFMGRLGQRGKLLICGSPEQCDLPPHQWAYEDFVADLDGTGPAGVVRFTEEMSSTRHPSLPELFRARRLGRERRASRG